MDYARFWSKTRPEGDCLVWTAYKRPSGYGYFGWKGKVCRAHRIAYEIANGPFDQSLCVCHRCDNPSCVKPEHLFLGSHGDNMRDAQRKGRLNIFPAVAAAAALERPRGAKHHQARLTEQQVVEIRNEKACGLPIKEIIRHYPISYASAYDLLTGKTWACVGGPIYKKRWSRKK